jgi:hypothetical protein
MVADSLDTGAVKRFGPKIFRRHDYLVGTAGSSGLLQRILAASFPEVLSELGLADWIGRRLESARGDDGVELILCTRDLVWTIEGDAVYSTTGVAAVGCGAPYALGYLEAKPGDLVGAVRAACKHDPYCGGDVIEERLPRARKGRRPRR